MPVVLYAGVNGTQLYMTSPIKSSLAIYDAETLRQLGVLRDRGITPSQILISPQ